jgi:hypothetical protein
MAMSCSGAMKCGHLFHRRIRGLMNALQIEYMVVSFDEAEKNAKLSLRQTEILAKLNTIVDDICADCPEE